MALTPSVESCSLSVVRYVGDSIRMTASSRGPVAMSCFPARD